MMTLFIFLIEAAKLLVVIGAVVAGFFLARMLRNPKQPTKGRRSAPVAK
jgi:hypothetical protein